MTYMKERIQEELKKKTLPDLKIIFSDEAMDKAPELLNELLEEEKEAFEKLLELSKNEITFESFEDEGVLDYYWSLLNHFQNVKNIDTIRKIIEDFRPKLQDFSNYVAYHKGYYDMLVYCRQNCELNKDQIRAMDLRIKAFQDRGIDLENEKQEQLKELNKILSEISNTFSNNIVDDESRFEYVIEDFEIIKDIPKDVLELAQSQAQEKNISWYLFTADPTAYVAIMKYCSDPQVREEFEKARNSFATSWKYDNRPIVLDILKYKQQKAQLLGFQNYAELSLYHKMADSPQQVCELIEWISHKAKTKALQELEELKKAYHLDRIESYDIAYYSRKLKEEKYQLDEKKLKEYFRYEDVLQYLHNFVKDFYGVELREVNMESYDPDVKLYEVYKQGELISYYLLDAFYRKEKRWWAWADNLREKNALYGKIPLVVNVCNFQKSQTTLLLLRDVETLFHEFGHALHEMLSQSTLAELSWFNVEWDFVELPSQLLENWVTHRKSLSRLAKHYQTGEVLSEEILDTLDNLQTFMSGAFVARQNEFALLDMHLYSWEVPNSVEELDWLTLGLVNKYGYLERQDDYKMYASFGHIFGGGYAAGYYSYMWAEILEADVFDEIESQGMFDPAVGKKFVDTLLWQGTRKSADVLFYDFMGRNVDNTAFMKRKWLLEIEKT